MNFPVLFLAGMFLAAESHYFGWHAGAHSDAEIVCDGIFYLLVALAWLRWRI